MLITVLSNPEALQLAQSFACCGVLRQQGSYCYLKLDDDYIHQIYPLVSKLLPVDDSIKKPDYFLAPNAVGAHISVIYPEERVRPVLSTQDEVHRFTIERLVKVLLGGKFYYVLAVYAPSLEVFRQMHALDAMPTFKQEKIFFHITIAIEGEAKN